MRQNPHPPPRYGMLPDASMAACSRCGHLSYLAALEGVCLGCRLDDLHVNARGIGYVDPGRDAAEARRPAP